MGKNFFSSTVLSPCGNVILFASFSLAIFLSSFSSSTDSIYKSEYTNLVHRNVKDLHSVSARIGSFIIELGLIRVTKPKAQHRLPSSKRRLSQIQSFCPRELFMMMELLHICALQPSSYSTWLLGTWNVVSGWPITQHSSRDLQVNEKHVYQVGDEEWQPRAKFDRQQVLWEVPAEVLSLLGNWVNVLGLSRI